MKGILTIALSYVTKDGNRVLTHQRVVSRVELDSISTGHRDLINLRFKVGVQELKHVTFGRKL